MAQAMASMAAAFTEGGHMSIARLPATSSAKPRLLTARAHHSSSLQCAATESAAAAANQSSRRSLLGLLAATVSVAGVTNKALAAATSIKVAGPPPPSGGLSGTKNSDEARDLDLPLKERFYLQPLSPSEAAARAKESAKEILNVKDLINKKAWPYVQNDLRLRASYLRYDLNTVISAMPKDKKMPLKTLTNKLFDTLDNLDYAAREKSTPKAEKYYAETVSALNDVLANLG
ncbi:hypothetical protein SUGI_0652970 [Cryptomeria japonica]|uniref:oxygen-evolving enhancer protein 3-2, chloroplastic n=1 Tax=Cryptomeria japonica TaxID=3369 RepID=UPI002414C947|nr:oxygen-evolving enhancer protein 3-2, chloroplastic [Cryptomeria japonica]GLJ32454.1 hypothetical protein SUGI_0652970 [Cryptomeria japonica]